MNKKYIILAVIIAIVAAGSAFFYSNQKSQEIKPPVSRLLDNSPRIDSQITFKIPEGKAEEVYQYLRKNYVESNDLLRKGFPTLYLEGENREDVSKFTDDYFDTPNMDLEKTGNSARHRLRINTTDPNDPKSGRELVQVKLTPPGQFDMRTELKYEVEKPGNTPVADDLHPLMKYIARDKREDFKKAFQEINLNPYSLRYILTNHQTRSRVYIDLDRKNILSMSVDEGYAKVWWAEAKISSIDIGLVEKEYTAASPEKKLTMERIRDFIIDDLKKQFPELEENSDDKYSLLFRQIESQIPYLPLLFKLRLI